MEIAGPVRIESFHIMVNTFSNWAKVEVIQSTSSTAVITCFRRMYATHGLSDVIVSDNCTTFTRAQMRVFKIEC